MAADEIAFAVVVDADTDTVVVLPPDPGTDREALGVARFSLTAEPGDRGIVGVVARVLLSGPGRKVVNVLTGKVARAAASPLGAASRPEGVRLFRPRDPVEAPMTAEAWARLSGGPSPLGSTGRSCRPPASPARPRPLGRWRPLPGPGLGLRPPHRLGRSTRQRDLLRLVAEAGTGPLVVDVVAHSRGLVAQLAERSRDTPDRPLADPRRHTQRGHAAGRHPGHGRRAQPLRKPARPGTRPGQRHRRRVVAIVTQVLGDAVGELPA